MLSAVRGASTGKPVGELAGNRETRGAAIGEPNPVQVHSVRLPGYVLSCEVVFGRADERLVIRHDAGASAAPYVAGTLLAARRVADFHNCGDRPVAGRRPVGAAPAQAAGAPTAAAPAVRRAATAEA